MRAIRIWLGSSVLLLAGGAGLTAQVPAGSGSEPAAAGFRSQGDIRAVNVEEELATLRSANEKLIGSTARRPVTFAAALAKARELAAAAVAPASLANALKALPNNEPVTLRLFAFAQLARGQPSASFALLVAAYDRDPQSPDALADLAGMLAGFGFANEAIAFLDELAARNALPAPPMGISGRDAVDYIRGYALVRLGNVAAAKPLLRGVAERQPVLAEAARMMAIIADDPAEQRKYLLLGVWRHRSPLMVAAGVEGGQPEPDALATGDEVAIDVRSLINPAKAKRSSQPLMHYAQSVLQANDLMGKMEQAQSAAEARARALLEQRVRPRGYVHTDGNVDETWGYRMLELLTATEYRDAKLRALDWQRHVTWNESLAARKKITDRRDEAAGKALDAYMQACVAKHYHPSFEQMGEQARPAFAAALAEYAPYINREDLAERAWFDEWHYLATGIAAQVGDAGWHEYIRLTIEGQRWHSYHHLLSLVHSHADIGQHPWITKEPGEVPTDPVAAEVEKCDGSKSLSFGTDQLPGSGALPFGFNVAMSCEGMSLDASVDTRIPGVSISAEISGDNAGSFTAFVGSKAELTMGQKDIAAFSAGVKGGAYVTGNKNGVTDAGVKYVATAGAKLGFDTTSKTVAEGSVSFFPAPSYSPGDFGPLGG
ncbi:MAG: hypothetical protein JWQ62_1979 [Lacunisphaera sp.]|nr:hypothetical protein [Lacunisphaera sp.]